MREADRAEDLIDASVDDPSFDGSISSVESGAASQLASLRTDLKTPLDDFNALLTARYDQDIPPLLRSALDEHLQQHFQEDLTQRATRLLYNKQPHMSALSPTTLWQKAIFVALGISIPFGLIIAPTPTFLVVLYAIFFYCTASMALKGILTLVSLTTRGESPQNGTSTTPIVTILLPVHNEGLSLASLVMELERLDYPAEKLDLKFLVEADDPKTLETLEALHLPPQFEVLTIPESQPQTKPKAMNYALPFVRGEIVGIYDAEDAPESDQVRKAVNALNAADEQTVCVQARLNHYNATETVLSRMAQAEYTLWFDILLKGLSKLRLPVPLGGTSLFIRTDALRAIDGWDPYNVTEDADLGLRLARRGWRAEVIDSTTWEEPPVEWDQWRGQRSRWIKGFMVTWLVHLRSPRALVQDLGWKNALAINIMLLDGFVAFLLQPIFWIAVVSFFAFGEAPWSSLLHPSIATATIWVFFIGQAFILGAAFIALWRRFGIGRALWAPGLWLYWQFATRPAYRALREMFGNKTFWNKTEHGLSAAAKQRQEAALRNR